MVRYVLHDPEPGRTFGPLRMGGEPFRAMWRDGEWVTDSHIAAVVARALYDDPNYSDISEDEVARLFPGSVG